MRLFLFLFSCFFLGGFFGSAAAASAFWHIFLVSLVSLLLLYNTNKHISNLRYGLFSSWQNYAKIKPVMPNKKKNSNNKNGKNPVLWAMPAKDVISYLKSSLNGLSHQEAKSRLKKYGANEIAKKEKRHGFSIFISQFKNSLILILIASTIVSYFLGEKTNAAVILCMVLLSTILGFVQEYKAERALRMLKKYIAPRCKVIRNGRVDEIQARFLVPGDIVYLSIGDVVPADIRLIQIDSMTTDESSLTGESLPVLKKTTVVSQDHSLPQYLQNVVFMGTSVSSGNGRGIVTATGASTFFGKTAGYLKSDQQEGDFQKNIRRFSNFLIKVILSMVIFIFLVNWALDRGWFDSFLFALALAVGITPEILPIIMTITLSNGALKMAKEKVVVKRIASVEDFGNIDTLCCDKTGTLTEGKISLSQYYNLDEEKDDQLVVFGMLCNTASRVDHMKAYGNPIDKAIWESPQAGRLEKEYDQYKLVDTNEFDFERRIMSVVAKDSQQSGDLLFIAKGAPESIFNDCDFALIKNKKIEIKNKLPELNKKFKDYEDQGYRVIAIAKKPIQNRKTSKEDEKNLCLIGFLLFLDPAKPTVKESLVTLEKLGVRIKVISGDSPVITRKICQDVGLEIISNRIITGDDLENIDDKKYEEYSNQYNVFARITPEQKYKIVSSLNKEGHIVGYLGDGVNDAPALRAADVGISVDMATGIARESADIILLQKSLNVLAHGIIEGRKTFGNITKYILNTISANYGNMFTVALSSLFMKFIPLLPSQILLNNFMSDIPNISISTDNLDAEWLKKPKRWDIKFISRFMIYFGLISSFFDLALILPLLFIFKASPEIFRTAWFVESCLSEIIIVYAIRTKLAFYKSRPSKWLVGVSLVTILATLIIPYTLFGADFFQFQKMPINIVIFIFAILITYFIVVELMKRKFYKKFEI